MHTHTCVYTYILYTFSVLWSMSGEQCQCASACPGNPSGTQTYLISNGLWGLCSIRVLHSWQDKQLQQMSKPFEQCCMALLRVAAFFGHKASCTQDLDLLELPSVTTCCGSGTRCGVLPRLVFLGQPPAALQFLTLLSLLNKGRIFPLGFHKACCAQGRETLPKSTCKFSPVLPLKKKKGLAFPQDFASMGLPQGLDGW